MVTRIKDDVKTLRSSALFVGAYCLLAQLYWAGVVGSSAVTSL